MDKKTCVSIRRENPTEVVKVLEQRKADHEKKEIEVELAYVVRVMCEENMTDEEKVTYPTYKTTGGYLKALDESECGQLWWDSLTDDKKNIIKSIPNFDAEIFEQCTGIKVVKEQP